MMKPRVDVDLNSRTWDGLVRAGFENVDAALSVGQDVLAWQSDDELIADAVVERVDQIKHLLYLRVKWNSLRDDQEAPTFDMRLGGLPSPVDVYFGQTAIAQVGNWNA